MSANSFILTLSCPDKPGIVARVSAHLFERGCNILDAQQYDDEEAKRFFMRVVFDPGHQDVETLRTDLEPLAGEYDMRWTLRASAEKRRVMILVSAFDHCLVDLLYRWRNGEMPMDLAAVVSNHPIERFAHVDLRGVPFHYLPVTPKTKFQQEGQLAALINESRTEIVVLARYMQVLSDGLAATLEERCINIHHSFLPGFKGAKPYHQAHARGVKTIGATAHYVTGDLDEGPIIEQDVERISHRDTPGDLIRKGRDIERRVLARAVRWRLEDRVLLNGKKTVVFTD
jgi:formyltetrahydrofolate deformylase